MPLRLRHNPYPGVNAHLHGWFQQRGDAWESYHAAHIVNLSDELNTVLPRGYFAAAESSLQLRRISEDDAQEEGGRRTADVSVFQRMPSSSPAPAAAVYAPNEVLPLIDSLNLEKRRFTSVSIVQRAEREIPVVRIELLSPANKPRGSYHDAYLASRVELLESGLTLVEIDYLHFLAPIVRLLPSYAHGEAGAYPYRVTISLPQPALETGVVHSYGWHVDEVLPIVTIPLVGDDQVHVSFQQVYATTFTRNSRRYEDQLDYAADPPAFERYTAADREKIAALLAAVRANPPAV